MKSNFSKYKEGQYWAHAVSSHYSCRIIRKSCFIKLGVIILQSFWKVQVQEGTVFSGAHTHIVTWSKTPLTHYWALTKAQYHGLHSYSGYKALLWNWTSLQKWLLEKNQKKKKPHLWLFCSPEIIIWHRCIIIIWHRCIPLYNFLRYWVGINSLERRNVV